MSDSLYDSDELPLPGAAMRTVEVQMLTERGSVRQPPRQPTCPLT